MGRRTWIKIYTDKWLRGSLRKEMPEIRSVFIDLLALAGDSAYGDNGIIQLADDVGFTDEAIAGMLNIPVPMWLTARNTLSNHNTPQENRIEIIPLNHGFAIKIINWEKYQSEYARQKPLRKQEKNDKVTDEVTPKVQRERERDRDRERDKEEDLKKDIVDFLDYFNLKTKKKLTLTPERERIIKQRLKDHPLADLKKAVNNFSKDDWPERHKYTDMVYCIGIRNKIDNLEKWLNWTPNAGGPSWIYK